MRLRTEQGFTLVELLAVMVIMSFVMVGLISVYLSGTHTEAKLTADFQAQTALHVGIDKMRTDVHLACSQTAQSATSITLSLPPCDGTKVVTWCTQANGASYSLYRNAASTCGGLDLADYLTGGSIFTYTAQNVTTGSNALPRLHIDISVNGGGTAATTFRVTDDLVFSNGARQ